MTRLRQNGTTGSLRMAHMRDLRVDAYGGLAKRNPPRLQATMVGWPSAFCRKSNGPSSPGGRL